MTENHTAETLREYQIQLGLTRIELESKTRLLDSCETALQERDDFITSMMQGCAVSNMNELAKEIILINTANGWNCTKPEQWADTYKIPAVLALVHTEVSEAVEAFREDDKVNFAEELADVIIRVLDLCGGLEIDIDTEIRKKLEKNKTRSHRHGGKRV